MKIRCLAVLLAFGVAGVAARAQEMPKPGPAHAKLKELVGEWDATVKFGDSESKGKSVMKLDFGGFFLIQEFEGEAFGAKFKGRGTSGYCPIRKKYVSTWIDSMSPSMMTMHGSYDKDGKTFTEVGEGPSMEGKMVKMKSVTTMPDKDTMIFKMYEVKDGQDQEMMTITYKRKK